MTTKGNNMTDFLQTAAFTTLIGETYLLRFKGKLAYGVVKFASARTGVVVHFAGERHVFAPVDFYTAATKGC